MLQPDPDVCLADILAARKDLAIVEIISCSNVRKRTKTDINKVMIGRVSYKPHQIVKWVKSR